MKFAVGQKVVCIDISDENNYNRVCTIIEIKLRKECPGGGDCEKYGKFLLRLKGTKKSHSNMEKDYRPFTKLDEVLS